MPSTIRTFLGAAMLAVAYGQGVILKAEGDSGTSQGLFVNANDPTDANVISDAEISGNVVNQCGRTLAGGNIDVGENTETALANKQITKVKKGSKVKLTVDQRNAQGTGPFTCDQDPTGNTLGASGQTPLTVDQANADGSTGQMTMTVTMPSDMACIGSSAGNVCTVRCRNAQNFGGCVAVQQTDTKALAGDNPPSNINASSTLAEVQAQVQQDQKDLPAAIAGNVAATTVDDQGVKIAQSILDSEPEIVASAQKEVQSKTASASAAAATGGANGKRANGKTGGNGVRANAAAVRNANAAVGGNENVAAQLTKAKAANKKRETRVGRRRGRFVNAGNTFAEEGGN